MSFRTRLSLVLGGLVLVLVATTSLVIYQTVRVNLDRQIDRFLIDRVSTVAQRLSGPLALRSFGRGERFRVPLGEALLDARFDVESQVIDRSGAILLAIGENSIPVTSTDIAIANGAPAELRSVTLDQTEFRLYVVPLRGGGAIQIARNIEETSVVLHRIRNGLLLLSGALVILAAFAGWWIAKIVTRPLRLLSVTANDVAATGSLDVSVPEHGASELRSLAASFNAMLAKIRGSVSRERQFVQDASHEIRTPLTSLRANSELLERAELTSDERSAILRDIRAEVDALTTISSELSTLATDQRHVETPIDINLSDATDVIVERMRRRSKRQIHFRNRPDAIHASNIVRVRHTQFERAVSNVIDNALKFSPDDSVVEVEVGHHSVSVIDHGVGIKEEDKARVFTRFFRADSTRALPGSGLGLAIVQQFVTDHGAQIEVTDTPGGGSTFHLRL
ncbi:MAG: ATP-binding protein [Ilumatobacteraceae bacterium]